MAKVSYNQSGYVGMSMSERAVEAYEDGQRPKSKWTKAAMLDAIQDYCKDYLEEQENQEKIDGLSKWKKAEIWEKFFTQTSWHHTGKFANETDFYGIDEDTVWGYVATKQQKEEAEREEQERLKEIRSAMKKEEEKRRQLERELRPKWAGDSELVSIRKKIEAEHLETKEVHTWFGEEVETARVDVAFLDGMHRSFFVDELDTRKISWTYGLGKLKEANHHDEYLKIVGEKAADEHLKTIVKKPRPASHPAPTVNTTRGPVERDASEQLAYGSARASAAPSHDAPERGRER